MREYAVTLKEFSKGLRPDASAPRNNQFLTDAYNVRCGALGLEVPPLIYSPFTGLPTFEWPGPQLIKVHAWDHDSTGMYVVTSSVSPAFGSLYKVNANYSLTLISALIAQGPLPYTIADFGLYQLWSNGTTVLIRYPDAVTGAETWAKAEFLDGGNPPPLVITNFRGQAVCGIYCNLVGLPGETVVSWSEIGQLTIGPTNSCMWTPYIDAPVLDGTGKKPYKATSGNYKLDPLTIASRVLPLGNAVVVYTSRQVIALPATSQPIPTFGFMKLQDHGISEPGCVAGDERHHLYLTFSGELWMVDQKLEPKKLGYKEFVEPLIASGQSIMISHNPAKDDFYISNGSICYLLSPQGMTKVFQIPTSFIFEETGTAGRLIGVRSNLTDTSAYVVSDILDMQVRGIKTITALEIGSAGQALTAGVDNRYDMSSAFTTGTYKTVNKHGSVSPIVSGAEFKVKVKGADYTKFDLDYINVRFKYVDKRMIRGPYAKNA